jgi:uncharacterized protein (TIRG00374 family)
MKITRTHAAAAVKILISCAFFYILFSFVQTNELLNIFARIDWLYFSLSFLLIPVMLSASCLKWQVILGKRASHIRFGQLLRIYMVGYFFSNLLPSTVGGDVIRSYYSGRLLDNQTLAAVSIFIERFTGILLLFFLVAFAPLCAPELYGNPYIFLPAAAGLVLFGMTLCMWWVKDPFALPRQILRFVFRCLYAMTAGSALSVLRRGVVFLEDGSQAILAKLQKVREELTVALDAFRDDRIYLVKVLLLTVIFYVLTWVNVYVSFRAFGVRTEFLYVCALVPAILFAAHVPVTLLGNLGYFESVFVFYFLIIGIPGAETLAMGLLLRMKMLTLGLIGYVMYLFYTHKNHGEFENLEDFARQ